jgi:hypothetical protein
MTMYKLPLTSNKPHYRMELDLDGSNYAIYMNWNDRARGWFMSLELPDGTQLMDGRRVVLSWPLLARITDPRRPPGEIVCLDTSGEDREPGRHDIGERVQVLYADRQTLAAMLAQIPT